MMKRVSKFINFFKAKKEIKKHGCNGDLVGANKTLRDFRAKLSEKGRSKLVSVFGVYFPKNVDAARLILEMP